MKIFLFFLVWNFIEFFHKEIFINFFITNIFKIFSLFRTFCFSIMCLALKASDLSFRFIGQNFQLRWKPHFVCPIYLSVHKSEQINFVNLWLVNKPSDLSFRFIGTKYIKRLCQKWQSLFCSVLKIILKYYSQCVDQI